MRKIFLILSSLLFIGVVSSKAKSCIDAAYVDTWSYPTPQLYLFSGTQYLRYDLTTNKVEGINQIANGYIGVPFGKIDAAYVDTWSYPTPQLYLFSGTQYLRYDVKANKVEGISLISKGYNGVPFSKIDAAYVDTWSYPTPQLYLFSGTQYLRYDVKANKVEGISLISKGYQGVPFVRIDAAYVDTWSYSSPQLYLFRGSQYLMYNLVANQIEGINNIDRGYSDLPFRSVNSAYVDTWSYPTPQLYLFSGSQYLRYDIKDNQVEGVNQISNGYQGVPFSGIDATYVDTWSYPTPQLYLFSGTQYLRYDVKANKVEGISLISKGYNGVPFSKIDAAYVDTWSYPTPQLYLFSGTQYLRYDVKANKVEGINDISKGYQGVPFVKIDAAYVDTWSYSSPQLYLFSGSHYLMYNLMTNKIEGLHQIANGYRVPFCK